LHLKNESKIEEVQFNFKRGGITPKPPLPGKSLFEGENEEEVFFNRTAEAGNQVSPSKRTFFFVIDGEESKPECLFVTSFSIFRSQSTRVDALQSFTLF